MLKETFLKKTLNNNFLAELESDEYSSSAVPLSQGIAFLVRVSATSDEKCPNCVILRDEKTRFGRHSDVKMDTVAGKEVSKKHAVITRKTRFGGTKFTLEDMGSVNGTFVNGRKIVKQTLRANDVVVFAGGNKLGFGDVLKDLEQFDCSFRFILPQIPVDFSRTADFNSTIKAESEDEDCPVCYSHAHKLHSLACGHAICTNCLSLWAAQCHKEMRPCLCPICRTPFAKSEIKSEDAVFSNGVEFVKVIEPLLRAVSVNSVQEITELAITEPWDDKKRSKFFSMNELILKNRALKRQFHTLTNATYGQILQFNDEQLACIMSNFGGDPKRCKGKMLEEVIAMVGIHIMKIRDIQLTIKPSFMFI